MPTPLKLSRVQRKGQVTIPREIRRRLGLREGDLVAFTETEQGFVITPQKVVPAELLDKWDQMIEGAEKSKPG
jgi:antitoxin PrlF